MTPYSSVWPGSLSCTRTLYQLARPFEIRRVQRTKKNYGAAVKYAYVEPEDEIAIREGGYLERPGRG